MCKKILLSFLVVLFVSATLGAQQMKGHVALSDDFSFNDKWYNITFESTPIIRDVSEIYRHQTFFALPFIGGFQVDQANMPHVSYSIKALAPNGEIYFSYDSINAITYEVPNPSMFILANSSLGISFEDNDLLGEYIISGTITDNISKNKINFEKKIKLIDFVEKKAFANDTLFGEWMQNYFQPPKPEYAISNYLKFLSTKNNPEFVSMLYSFYIELFRTNDFLFDILINKFDKQSKEIQEDILTMYVYANIKDDIFLNSLNRKHRKKVKSLQLKDNPFDVKTITHPAHLDMLWAKFFADGSYEPIQKIVSTFSNSKYLGSLEKLGKINDLSQLNEDSWKELIYQAATWSVKANLNSYPLVKDYCTFIYFDINTPVGTKNILAGFLNKEK